MLSLCVVGESHVGRVEGVAGTALVRGVGLDPERKAAAFLDAADRDPAADVDVIAASSSRRL